MQMCVKIYLYIYNRFMFSFFFWLLYIFYTILFTSIHSKSSDLNGIISLTSLKKVDVETEDGTTPLHFAAYNGSLSACEWLLSTGRCDVNKQNYYGCNTSQWFPTCHDYIIYHNIIYKDFISVYKLTMSTFNEKVCVARRCNYIKIFQVGGARLYYSQ